MGNYIKYINTLNSNILEPCLVNAFILKNGVCMDFSVALWKCLDRLNIESNIIKGIANSQKTNSIAMFDHAWNQIKIDNKWYNIDLTWFNTTKKIDFVLVDDENFYKNNRHESRFEKKMCRYNYDRQQVENKVKEFEKYKNIFEEFDKGNKSIKLHLVREQ